MNTTKLIEILNWPSTKTNHYRPLYRILWNLCLFPLSFLFALGFYLIILLNTFSFYQAELFRKDYF